MNHPHLMFSKNRSDMEDGPYFEDAFNNKNLKGFDKMTIREIERAAAARVDYWNKIVQGWHYELKGWVVK